MILRIQELKKSLLFCSVLLLATQNGIAGDHYNDDATRELQLFTEREHRSGGVVKRFWAASIRAKADPFAISEEGKSPLLSMVHSFVPKSLFDVITQDPEGEPLFTQEKLKEGLKSTLGFLVATDSVHTNVAFNILLRHVCPQVLDAKDIQQVIQAAPASDTDKNYKLQELEELLDELEVA